jgi:putative transposase
VKVNFLKKTTGLSHCDRRALVERAADALPLTTQAELLSISCSSLYYQPKVPSPAEVPSKHRIDAL